MLDNMNGSQAGSENQIALQESAGQIQIPNGVDLHSAVFLRDGSDLLIQTNAGDHYVAPGYFNHDTLADLNLPNGHTLSGSTFDGTSDINAQHQFAQVDIPGLEVAQAQINTQEVGAPIGTVDNVEGAVSVTHVDGTTEFLNVGDKVYQGDVLETETGAGVGITLADTSVFSLGEEGQLVLDELVYDPGTQDGSTVISLVEGTASFVSGQIAKINPDAVSITTPVATIGIRGTKVFVEYKEGEFKAVNMIETTLDGEQPGEIVVYDMNGTPIGSTNQANIGWSWNPTSGGTPTQQQFTNAQLENLSRDAVRNLPQNLVEKAVEAREMEQMLKETADIAREEAVSAKEEAQRAEEEAALAKEQALLAQEEAEKLLAMAAKQEALMQDALEAKEQAELEMKLALEAEQRALEALAEAERALEAERLAREAARDAHQFSVAAIQAAVEYTGYGVNGGTGQQGNKDTNGYKNIEVEVNSAYDTEETEVNNTFTQETGLGNDQIINGQTDQTGSDQETESTTDTSSDSDTATITTSLNISGTAVDGYLSGSKVFLDFNKNGIIDGDESNYVVITDENGNFTLNFNLSANQQDYVISVIEGTDTSTNATFYGSLQAPNVEGVSIISPLTTLMANGVSQSDLLTMFGLDANIDLLKDDPVELAKSADGTTATAYSKLAAVGVQLQNIIIQAGNILEGATTGTLENSVASQVFKTIATQITNSGGTLDLKDATQLGNVITQAAQDLQDSDPNLTVNITNVSNNATATANQIVQTNNKIDTAITEGKTGDALFTETASAQNEASNFAETAKTAVKDGGNVNVNPVADDSVTFTTNEDQNIVITASQLLGDSSDYNEDVLSITNLSVQGNNGTLTPVPSEGSTTSWTFSPADNFNGEITLSYDVSDGTATDSTTAKITVNSVNDAPIIGRFSLDAGTEYENYTLSASDILDNVSDMDGDPLSLNSVSSNDETVNVENNNDGTWTITSSEEGLKNINFVVSDGTTTTSGSTAIDFADVNNTLSNDSAEVTEDRSVTISVLDNDTIRDGATITAVAGSEHGSVTIDGTNVVYTATSDYSGGDTFSYTVTDEDGETQTATVDITVLADADSANLSLNIGAGTKVSVGGQTETVTITRLNYSDTDNGYTMTGQVRSGHTPSVDALTSFSDPEYEASGIGVTGDESGQREEIGYSNYAESVFVDFDTAISSVDVAFSWLHSRETAAYEFFLNGQSVGTGTYAGITDKVDDPITISPTNNSSFDQVVFKPQGVDDDFLINSISFEKTTNSETYVDLPISLNATEGDSDGSETLSNVTLSGIPDTAVLYVDDVAVTVTNGSVELSNDNLDNIKIRVTDDQDNFDLTAKITSTDGSDTQITTTSVNVPDYTFGADGADIIQIQSGNVTVSGGSGSDTLQLEAGFDPNFVSDHISLSSVENIDMLTDTAANSLTIGATQLTSANDDGSLVITGGSNDILTFAEETGWEKGQAVYNDSQEAYTVFSYNQNDTSAQVQVSQNVTVTGF